MSWSHGAIRWHLDEIISLASAIEQSDEVIGWLTESIECFANLSA
jgi:hypothetical protein